ncbi:tRNA (adenosine(37)-N6)-threonylcarbamoyltransferase complex dimerization subunit type 1 TsaB [Sphingobacteriaceae bacterium]|nr:tRNA (adenosine(37)-N6)-threonylcarbamoyltransferase complex dimerization subunit type 1 TsaB [Sphingobacteriaceae bacterium]
MIYLLNIETATTVCSVSISNNGELIFSRELNEGFTHAENLHLFIEQGLKESGIKAKDLSAIAVSKGPGSYTGLRIGVSTAKGLAYALNIPLISIDTLQLMAFAAFEQVQEEAFYCPMIDARRMEIYTAVYDWKLNSQSAVEALIVDENSSTKFNAYSKIYYLGDGMPKCKSLLETRSNAAFIENIYPSAKNMVKLTFNKFQAKTFENLAYFEPFYLKDFMILKKKDKI